jgi:GTP-binding protein YchF
MEMALEVIAFLEEGNMAYTFEKKDDELFEQLNQELRLLTAKEIMYGANVDEGGLAEDSDYVKAVQAHAAKNNSEVIKLCAKFEEDLVGMDDEEAAEFLEEIGVSESGLAQIIHKGFDKLGLMSYFTAGVKEVRAWTIRKNTTAPKAAAVIHNDFEKGFIRAEVIGYEDYIACGSESKAKEAGKMRLEGKEYIVQDGDIMHFRFNV